MTVPPQFPPEFPTPPGYPRRAPTEPTPPIPPTMPRPPASGPVFAPGAITVVAGLSGADAAFERLLDERIVYLGGEIDDELAHRVVAQLLALQSRDAEREITLYVSSPGGSATAGLAILDAMRMVTPAVATCAVGVAASVAAVLVAAGAPGRRRALPHARLVLQHPSPRLGGTIALGPGVFGTLKHEIALVVADRAGKEVDDVLADADTGRWFTAAEALEYGLVDEVLDGDAPTGT